MPCWVLLGETVNGFEVELVKKNSWRGRICCKNRQCGNVESSIKA